MIVDILVLQTKGMLGVL